jgi:maltooligosyltrehalose trehalohydrolase
MFMGEEWGADQPFPFFCDFAGDLAEAVRNGRRKEFAEEYIAGNADEIPDPLAEETFRSAVLDWTAREKPAHKRRLALVTELLATRRAQIVPRLARGVKPGEGSFKGPVLIARWPAEGGMLELLANLSTASAPRPHAPAGTPIWGGPPPADLPPWGVYWSWSPA